MNNKDIYEDIRRKLGVAFISDIKYIRKEKVMNALLSLEIKDYEPKDIRNFLLYLKSAQ